MNFWLIGRIFDLLQVSFKRNNLGIVFGNNGIQALDNRHRSAKDVERPRDKGFIIGWARSCELPNIV